MSETLEQICLWAQEMGATHARVVTDRTRLEAKESVRESCLQNACGKSGRCWTCPPHVGEFEALASRLLSYPGVVVVQSVAPLEDSWDFEGMVEAARAHNNRKGDLGRLVVERSPAWDVLSLGCGGCGYCEKCTCPDEPCRFPDKALGSVEGYGLDVKALVGSVGLRYINGTNTVSYVGAVMVRPEE